MLAQQDVLNNFAIAGDLTRLAYMHETGKVAVTAKTCKFAKTRGIIRGRHYLRQVHYF